MEKGASFKKYGWLGFAVVFTVLSRTSSANSFVATNPDTASEFYPLAIGDYWEYFDYADFGGGIVDTVSWIVRGDTTIEARNYRVIHCRSFRYHNQWDSFARFDSVGDLYTSYGGSEQLTYRFSDTSRTPWAIGTTLRRWERNFIDTLFGMPRHVLLALTYQSWDTLGLFGLGVYLTEGIGMTASPTLEGGGYRLRGAMIDGIVYGTITSVEEGTGGNVPSKYSLMQNYPNPFNPSTTIMFSLPHASWTNLTILNMIGQEIAVLMNEWKSAGSHSVTWSPSNLPSGVYLCRFRAGTFSQVNKILLLK
jgi:hypothetical protein